MTIRLALPGLALSLSLLATTVGPAHADPLECSRAKSQAKERFEQGLDPQALNNQERGVASELASAVNGLLRDQLPDTDRQALKAYFLQQPGAPDTEEIGRLIRKLSRSVPGYPKTRCASPQDEPITEGGFANVPSSRNGFSLCRKVVKEETSYVGHALSEIWKALKRPIFWDQGIPSKVFSAGWDGPLPDFSIRGEANRPNLFPETTRTYSYSYPQIDRSLDVLEPEAVSSTLSGIAPPSPERFKLRICLGKSNDTIHVTRLCRTLNLRDLAELRQISEEEIVAANAPRPTPRASLEAYQQMQGKEPCRHAALNAIQDERRAAVSGRSRAHREDEPVEEKPKSPPAAERAT